MKGRAEPILDETVAILCFVSSGKTFTASGLLSTRRSESSEIADGESHLWLGAKMVGRWQSGAPTVLTPQTVTILASPKWTTSFTASVIQTAWHAQISAHIRRSNPRDGFMLVHASRSIALSNRHRLLRRGRSYGPALTKSMLPEDVLAQGPDDVDRGLCFICLTANIARQFEFVQESWINDPLQQVTR